MEANEENSMARLREAMRAIARGDGSDEGDVGDEGKIPSWSDLHHLHHLYHLHYFGFITLAHHFSPRTSCIE
jgi:hypothetical protein